ncbi:hypothetical protein N7495_002228 [Penicillium taxi]|uniref:uncharacterized protein n=1 Tax=Penicillium taxi TaxID=168475 RepID=UPI002545A9B7|nr:uncharacterized protein N7495_002228 [Penicillium taxi]KAJ5901700.1 hypothetical protein N7495_002228 [Penicillium taxi]
MGQRHNRRRSRPTRNQKSSSIYQCQLSSPTTPRSNPSSASSFLPLSLSVTIPAPTWHYGCSTSQCEPTAAEQCRLFGGEPGDDVNLCYRMLEVFGGLDYIDPTSESTLGD